MQIQMKDTDTRFKIVIYKKSISAITIHLGLAIFCSLQPGFVITGLICVLNDQFDSVSYNRVFAIREENQNSIF